MLSGLLGQNILLLCRYAEQKGFWTTETQSESFSCMLCVFFSECQVAPIGWNMNYSVFGCFQWIRLDANILKTMTRKTEKKRLFFRPCGRSLNVSIECKTSLKTDSLT